MAYALCAVGAEDRQQVRARMEGKRIGNYRIVRHLGSGGMASVFEAVHEVGGVRAALKVLHPSLAGNHEVAVRFRSEAHAANLVHHPGLVRVLDSGQLDSGVTYLAMEYLDGVSLHARLNQLEGGRLPPLQAVYIGAQLASALSALHARKIVHRDLKPENIMLIVDGSTPGGEQAKILDFGIAKLAAADVAPGGMVTRTGMLMGTPTYMAPEQCRGARGVDDRADVYALGVILYQLIAGQPPFSGSGPAEVMAMHLFDEPPPVRGHTPQISGELARLVHELLRKQPAQRPAMAEVARRLSDLGGMVGDFTAVVPRLDLRSELPTQGGRPWPLASRAAMPTVLVGERPPTLLPADLLFEDSDPHTRRTVLPRRRWLWMVLLLIAAAAAGGGVRWFLGPGSERGAKKVSIR